MQTEPVLVALLFADHVVVEANTNKKTIVGAFTQFHSDSFPILFPPWWIYVAVDNVSGSPQYALNLVNDETDQVIIGISGQISIKDDPGGVEMQFKIPNAVFPTAGRYNLILTVGSHRIGSRVLRVDQTKGSR